MAQNNSPVPKRDINAVIASEGKKLLAIPGIVGVYAGVLGDGRTPCLKLMLARARTPTDPLLPQELGGFPVVTEVTGEVRPLKAP